MISNAIKFTPNDKNVDLTAKFNENEQSIYFCVKDSGIGISQEKLEYIFEAFSQEDESTTRKYGGTGLGLSISSRLIQLMGGELKVASQLGEGSRFYFDIPIKVCEDDFQEEKLEIISDEDVVLQGHILIVEDNKKLLMSQMKNLSQKRDNHDKKITCKIRVKLKLKNVSNKIIECVVLVFKT